MEKEKIFKLKTLASTQHKCIFIFLFLLLFGICNLYLSLNTDKISNIELSFPVFPVWAVVIYLIVIVLIFIFLIIRIEKLKSIIMNDELIESNILNNLTIQSNKYISYRMPGEFNLGRVFKMTVIVVLIMIILFVFFSFLN